jgi:hypothetical protein
MSVDCMEIDVPCFCGSRSTNLGKTY